MKQSGSLSKECLYNAQLLFKIIRAPLLIFSCSTAARKNNELNTLSNLKIIFLEAPLIIKLLEMAKIHNYYSNGKHK
jgi:hypothetical protein